MAMLIDTHILLWYLLTPKRLSSGYKSLLRDPGHPIYVSAASVWEASIKQSIDKLHVPANLNEGIRQVGFFMLEITAEDAWQAGQLPYHHQDPFDRMLIAQALNRDWQVVTDDKAFAQYGVAIWQP